MLDKRLSAAAALLAALLVAGCGPAAETGAPRAEEAGNAAPGPPGTPADEGVRVPLVASDGFSEIGIEGVLQVEGRCLYLVQPGGSGGRTLPAFTVAGVRWDEPRGRLLINDSSFAPGQRVSLGGSVPAKREKLRWL